MSKIDREGPFDCIVVGGGHAGVEASSIVSRAGYSVLLLSLNLDEIAQMSCNPAIGGIAKGHIVREIDALGGLMGQIIDHTGIHYKMLNLSKGSAMWSPRAQADKYQYKQYAKNILENSPNLQLRQDSVCDLIVDSKQNKITGVVTDRGNKYYASHVILTTGTFLKGKIHIGDHTFSGGRIGAQSAERLSGSLEKFGFEVSRLKTGTPPRIHAATMNLNKLEAQEPDKVPQPFSFAFEYDHAALPQKQIPCYITYTTAKTKEIVEKNLLRSALYGGKIKSVGPRYCPSIEDKIVRFADKERHQIFLEPEGLDTNEVYVNGISTSLPEDVQWEIVNSIIGLEDAQIMRPGYAIEYDFCPPTQLHPWLETKKVEGLFFAGQINGTTGYEEAGAQGLMAGYNVIHKIRKMDPLVLGRDEAYIGVLIDDLVTKGVEEPYRMFTSRAEYRLFLRQDNADFRLMKYPHNVGLDRGLYARMQSRYECYNAVKIAIEKTKISEEILVLLGKANIDIQKGLPLSHVFKRPQVPSEISIALFDYITNFDSSFLSEMEKIKLSMDIKYEGYVIREMVKTKRRMEAVEKIIPEDIDYDAINGLKTEAREKLKRVRPVNLGQAARISGVDPSDIDIVLLNISKAAKQNKDVSRKNVLSQSGKVKNEQ
ncbi:MAG: tRNA uridine-5-carboxymethylaminomethyl(34) synthesis enzyme MnmG [Leptospirales bacterium]